MRSARRTVLCAEGNYEPSVGITEYLRLYPATREDPVTVLLGVRRTPLPPDVLAADHVTVESYVPGRGLNSVSVDYRRDSYHDICERLRAGALPLHAVVACGSTPDDGRRTLGVINGYLQLALDVADIVLIEEVPGLVAISGAAITNRADHVVEYPVVQSFSGLSKPPDAISRQIAATVAGLIPDGATISLGVGRIADAVAEHCGPGKNLRFRGGAITDNVRTLEERGALDPRAPIEGMSVVGPQTLVDWAAAHENLRLRPSTEIHDPVWLGQNDRFVVILGGLTCDRYGNINSERIGNRIVAGIGGAPDFAKGASLSKGGMCIVAMPAYDRQGMSALREQLPSVSVGRELVTAVVTEYGAAVRTSSESVWQRDLARVLPLHARAVAAT